MKDGGGGGKAFGVETEKIQKPFFSIFSVNGKMAAGIEDLGGMLGIIFLPDLSIKRLRSLGMPGKGRGM